VRVTGAGWMRFARGRAQQTGWAKPTRASGLWDRTMGRVITELSADS